MRTGYYEKESVEMLEIKRWQSKQISVDGINVRRDTANDGIMVWNIKLRKSLNLNTEDDPGVNMNKKLTDMQLDPEVSKSN